MTTKTTSESNSSNKTIHLATRTQHHLPSQSTSQSVIIYLCSSMLTLVLLTSVIILLSGDHHSTALMRSCLHSTPTQAAITSQGMTCHTSGPMLHTTFHLSAHGSSTLKTVPSLLEPKENPLTFTQRTNG